MNKEMKKLIRVTWNQITTKVMGRTDTHFATLKKLRATSKKVPGDLQALLFLQCVFFKRVITHNEASQALKMRCYREFILHAQKFNTVTLRLANLLPEEKLTPYESTGVIDFIISPLYGFLLDIPETEMVCDENLCICERKHVMV
jgi:hypothetical protein